MAPRTYKPTVKPGPGTYVQQPVTSPSKSPTIYRWGQPNPAMAAGAKAPAGKLPAYTSPASTPAAGTPASSSPAGPTPLPIDPQYDASVAGLTRTRDDTLAALSGQRTQTLGNYGYTAQYNPDGSVASVGFDVNSPFSRAALARTRYQQAKTGTQNSMASRGHLYSGAIDQAQGINDTNFNQGEDARLKQLGAALAGILSSERTAKTTYESGVGQAGADRVSRASSNPLYSPTLDQPAAAPAAPATGGISASTGLSPANRARIAAGLANRKGWQRI